MVSFSYVEKMNNKIAFDDSQINNIKSLESYLDKCLNFANVQFEKYKNSISLQQDSLLISEKLVNVDYIEGAEQGFICGTYIQKINTIRIFHDCVQRLSSETDVDFDTMLDFLLYHEAFHVIEKMENICLHDIYSIKTKVIFGVKSKKVGLFSSREIAANYFAYLMLERKI